MCYHRRCPFRCGGAEEDPSVALFEGIHHHDEADNHFRIGRLMSQRVPYLKRGIHLLRALEDWGTLIHWESRVIALGSSGWNPESELTCSSPSWMVALGQVC